jgi:hypothetical protein
MSFIKYLELHEALSLQLVGDFTYQKNCLVYVHTCLIITSVLQVMYKIRFSYIIKRERMDSTESAVFPEQHEYQI